MINSWIDQDGFSTDLILLALRESILADVKNIRYVNKILVNWQSKGIETAKQAHEQIQKHRQYQKQSPPTTPTSVEPSNTRKVPFYNWLEERG